MKPTSATIFAVEGKSGDCVDGMVGEACGGVAMYGWVGVESLRSLEISSGSSLGLDSVTTYAPDLEQRLDHDLFTDHCDAVSLLGQAWDASGDQKSIARGFDDFRFSIGAFEMVNVPQGLST